MLDFSWENLYFRFVYVQKDTIVSRNIFTIFIILIIFIIMYLLFLIYLVVYYIFIFNNSFNIMLFSLATTWLWYIFTSPQNNSISSRYSLEPIKYFYYFIILRSKGRLKFGKGKKRGVKTDKFFRKVGYKVIIHQSNIFL